MHGEGAGDAGTAIADLGGGVRKQSGSLDPTIVAFGPPWEKSTLSPGERRLSSRQLTALVQERLLNARGTRADPRPACLAAVCRTGGQLHAVLVKHRPRLLHARSCESLATAADGRRHCRSRPRTAATPKAAALGVKDQQVARSRQIERPSLRVGTGMLEPARPVSHRADTRALTTSAAPTLGVGREIGDVRDQLSGPSSVLLSRHDAHIGATAHAASSTGPLAKVAPSLCEVAARLCSAPAPVLTSVAAWSLRRAPSGSVFGGRNPGGLADLDQVPVGVADVAADLGSAVGRRR